MLVHDVDGLINWHLKEQLYVCEQEGRNLIPPLGKEGDAAASCKTCLNRRKVWNASKIEIAKEKQELPPTPSGIDMLITVTTDLKKMEVIEHLNKLQMQWTPR